MAKSVQRVDDAARDEDTGSFGEANGRGADAGVLVESPARG